MHTYLRMWIMSSKHHLTNPWGFLDSYRLYYRHMHVYISFGNMTRDRFLVGWWCEKWFQVFGVKSFPVWERNMFRVGLLKRNPTNTVVLNLWMTMGTVVSEKLKSWKTKKKQLPIHMESGLDKLPALADLALCAWYAYVINMGVVYSTPCPWCSFKWEQGTYFNFGL